MWRKSLEMNNPVFRALAFSLVLLVACTPPPPTASGFLEDYDRMQPVEGDAGARVWFARRGALAAYDRVLLAPVEFWVDPESAGAMEVEELRRLEEEVRDALVGAMGKDYPVVEEAAPGTVRLRVAVTRLVLGKPLVNAVTQVPPAGQLSAAKKLLTGTHLGVGQVAIEVAFSDSVTGEELVQYVDRHVGRKFDVLDGLTTWGQVEEGFRGWAEELRRRLDLLPAE